MKFLIGRGQVGLGGFDLRVTHNLHHRFYTHKAVIQKVADERMSQGVQNTTIQTRGQTI